MEYLNELDDNTLPSRIKNFLENVNDAEQYEATSIRDFLGNVGMIKPTRKNFLMPESKYNGFGLVWLTDNVRYNTSNDKEGLISDLSEKDFKVRLDVELGNGEILTGEELEQLVDGATLYNVMLLYNTEDKTTFLYQWEDHDEEIEEKEPDPVRLLNPKLRPSAI